MLSWNQSAAILKIEPRFLLHAPRVTHPGSRTQGHAPKVTHPRSHTQGHAPRVTHPESCTQGHASKVMHPGSCTQGHAGVLCRYSACLPPSILGISRRCWNPSECINVCVRCDTNSQNSDVLNTAGIIQESSQLRVSHSH